MNSIPRIRYDALAGYSRSPQTVLSSEELGWFEESDERVLGVVIRALEDNDFSSVVLARDRLGRFRAVWVDDFKPTPDEARERLGDLLRLWAAKPDEEYWQGDETGASLNLTIPASPEDRQHPSFRSLVAQEGYSPARELIAAMQFYDEDADGNFVEQFQTAGFDARIWELYLFATLTEMGYAVVRQDPTPDFHCVGLPGEFFVEATTVNPSVPSNATKSYSGSLADMTKSGHLDSVLSNDAPDPKLVLVNDGTGHFKVGGTYGDPRWPTRNAAVGDLNGDGYPDIAVANRGTTSYVCYNDGKLHFHCNPLADSPSASTILIADVNGDGANDVILPCRDECQSRVFFGHNLDGDGKPWGRLKHRCERPQ